MDKTEIFEFMNANPMFHLATMDGSKPRVRGLRLYRADENGIVFHTGKMKDLHKQLMENPQVEMCFINPDPQNLMQIRVSGVVELVEDIELKKEIVEKRDFLKPWIEQGGYDPLAVYRMKTGMGTIWRMSSSMAPKEHFEI